MQADTKVKTPSIGSLTEFVVLAPIRPGFVPALDAVTYKTRAKVLLQMLHAGRRSSHEYQLFRAFSDAAERVGVIHSVRVAVLDEEDKILLSVVFDGSYEAYVRAFWQRAPRLLDLIFCNSDRYVTGWDNTCDRWRQWLESVKVDTPFLYATPGVSYQDLQYLRMADRFGRIDAQHDENVTRIVIPTAETTAWTLICKQFDPQSGEPYIKPPEGIVGSREGVRQGLQGLVGIYRLADVYPPGSPDGVILQRAACELLPELGRMIEQTSYYESAIEDAVKLRFSEQMAWLKSALALPLPPARIPQPLPAKAPATADAQAGILTPHADVTHGCACLLSFDSPAGAKAFLSHFNPTTEGQPANIGEINVNVAFSANGLRACGLSDAQMEAWFPLEFRVGMEQRSGLLGDVRGNHPRRWRLPLLNCPAALDSPNAASAAVGERVALDAVHAMVTLRAKAADTASARLQMADWLKQRLALAPGVRALSVQWLERHFFAPPGAPQKVKDHFGYIDGESDPVFNAPTTPAAFFPNQIQLGEALVGYANVSDPAPPALPGAPLLKGGSYLVVRKLRQDVDAFDRAISAVVNQESGAEGSAINADEVKAKLMGRWHSTTPGKAGQPVGQPFTPGQVNDFDYQYDPQGAGCPLGAHIRRANPREAIASGPEAIPPAPGGRAPRLMRRGISYEEMGENGAIDKGLFFLAYNASIAEQFEVIQRWLAGGNSTGNYSGESCPFVGVPEAGRERFFRFEHGGKTVRMRLDGSKDLGDDPQPIVRLEWGAYLFAPSATGLQFLAQAASAASVLDVRVPWSAQAGEAHIERLRRIESLHGSQSVQAIDAWKAALEDPGQGNEWTAASIWCAIRELHSGLLKIPYGLLVASRERVDEVLLDSQQRYSTHGYQERLEGSIGAIYLGLDDDASGEYARQSAACNAAIRAIPVEQAFDDARQITLDALEVFKRYATERATQYSEPRWELMLDVRELVDRLLAGLCETWFGLSGLRETPVAGAAPQTGPHFFKVGGYRWTWKPGELPFYPGHFVAPSRDTFQPQPGETVRDQAVAHGQALREAMGQFLQAFGASIQAPVTRAVLDQNPAPSNDLAARTIVGAIMGFVPTMDGSLRRIISEWVRDGSLYRLKAAAAHGAPDDFAKSKALLQTPMMRALQARPVPELVWRTVRATHHLGADPDAVILNPGDRVILSLVSATQQGLQAGAAPDLAPMFGGVRGAPGASPTHACPGSAAAMSAMLGFLSALVSFEETLRPGLAVGVLCFDGTMPPTVPAPAPTPAPIIAGASLNFLATASVGAPMFVLNAVVPGSMGKLLAWGDSWVYNIYPGKRGTDLGDALADLGYDTSAFQTYSRGGLTLAEMAAAPTTGPGFYQLVLSTLLSHDQQGVDLPKAIVLDGGGNDVHQADAATGQRPLLQVLQDVGGSLPGAPFVSSELDKFVDQTLKERLTKVLDNLTAVTRGRIAIVVHGYDFPIPDGRPFFPFPGPWLKPLIDAKGYAPDPAGMAIMRTLITRLNQMISAVVATYPAALNVTHADLTGTLEGEQGFAQDYKQYWTNELHPTQLGFSILADRLKTLIQ